MPGRYVHLNGKLIAADEACVSVFDAGLLHGASAFTTMLAHNGVVFRLGGHIARLMETVHLLSLRVEAAPESLTAATSELLKANELKEARLRITLTPGSVRGGRPTTLIAADELPERPAQWYDKGICVVVASMKQSSGDPAYGNKTGCYLQRTLARQEAAAKGAEEALWFTPDNRLAEACFCNAFLVLGGKVRTPPRDTPALPGIVRQAVIELCEAMSVSCGAETPLTVHDLLKADEAFLTSSVSGIRPVVAVERRAVGEGVPGPVTRKIMSAYQELLQRECSAP